MREYTQCFLKKCLQCIRNESGKVRPLPWGEQMIAEKPGQILCADYLYLQAGSKTGDKYLLVLKDSFSHVCRLVPSVTPDALTFVRAFQQWCAQYGVPEAIITDGGSHFRCGITALMKKAMGYHQPSRHAGLLAVVQLSDREAQSGDT